MEGLLRVGLPLLLLFLCSVSSPLHGGSGEVTANGVELRPDGRDKTLSRLHTEFTGVFSHAGFY